MPNCTATTKSGGLCVNNGKPEHNGLCGLHHNSKMRTDTAYAAAYNARINGARDAAAAAAAQRVAAIEAEAAQRRAAAVQKNNQEIENAQNASAQRIIQTAQRVLSAWSLNNIPGWDIPKAYYALRYLSARHDGLIPLFQAFMHFYHQAHRHPDNTPYATIPEAERTAVLAGITAALIPYGNIDHNLIPTSDSNFTVIAARTRREREAREAEAEAAERERRRAQMREDLRERPVVFQRDPEGSINLAAFATDRQNIHRSSVQSATEIAVNKLLIRPIPEGQDTLAEIVEAFTSGIVRWSSPIDKTPQGAIAARDRTITMLTNDYFTVEAFGIGYGQVLNHVWAFIRSHTERKELVIRLAQEIAEGTGMCSNGKMAHIINALQGYDEMVDAPVEDRTSFQNKISAISKYPLADRQAAAEAAFAEFNIPVEEQAVWLEPLLEA